MVNHLALLGWSSGDDEDIFSLEELESRFDLARVQPSGAIFDTERLDWLNGQWIRRLPADELGERLEPVDMLKFRESKKYRDRLNIAQKATGESDALIVMRGALQELPLVAAAFEFRFMGGSMGSVVGERFLKAATTALEAAVGCSAIIAAPL